MFTASPNPPFTVLEKVTGEFVVVTVTASARATGLRNPTDAVVLVEVVRFEPRLLEPPPLCVKAPVLESGAAFAVAVVNVPVLVTVVVPPTVQAPFAVRLVPVNAKLLS